MMLSRFAAAVAVATLIGSVAVAADPTPKPIKALLVCGGCCHDYTNQKNLIAKGLEERAYIDVTVVQQGGSSTKSEIDLYKNDDWSKGYDIVIHDECFADAKDPAWLERILKPHKAGLPGVVVHCAMHCYRTGSDEWFKFCGVTSRRHGAQYPHDVLNRDAEHPIMKGFGPAWANPAGELYWIEKVWPTAHPLGSSKNKENGHDEVCVWTNQYAEKTRVFGTTIGHHNETVSDPAYLNLMTRGVLWACDKLDDKYLKPVAPKKVSINEAEGKHARASSEETGKGNFAANAFDGKPGTRWCASNANPGEWLEVDLGKPTKIEGITLEWESDGAVYHYKIEGSPDGSKWTTLVDASRNKKNGPYVHKKDLGSPRFVKVVFLGSDTGSWGSLREVLVDGGREEVVRRDERIAPAAADPRLADVKVPEGFEARVFAAPPAVNYPVYVAASPEGDVYVSVDRNGSLDREPHRGSVVKLSDLDGDGRADQAKLFVADVDSPRGLVWDHDRLYLMHPPHLSVYIDHDHDGIADEHKYLVKNIAFGFKDRPADHTSNGVTLGLDGRLYLAIGDFGFMRAEGADGRTLQLRGGGVVRVFPDGTGLELYSRGTRNILEVSLDPLLNAFARDNTNDGGGWDIRLHHFSGIEHHGYPSLFQNFSDEIVQPLADYGGGSGCGGLYLAEPGFPQGYGNALYTADWGRERIYRHILTPKGATFAADQTEFVAIPRATDLDVDAMSRLYISSWKGATFTYAGENVGYVIQVVPKGYKPDPLPDFSQLDSAKLIKIFEYPSLRRRLEAQRELLRRGLDDPTIKALSKLAGDRSRPIEARVAAIFALKRDLGPRSTPILVGLCEDSTVRAYALRALTDRDDELAGVPGRVIAAATADPDPRVRRQAAESLARLGELKQAEALVPLLADPDPIVAHTSIQALTLLKASDVCFGVVDDSKASPRSREAALAVLRSLHESRVVAGLIARLEKETDSARRIGLFTALCRLDFQEGNWKGDSWGTRPDTSGPYYQPVRWSESDRIESVLRATIAKAGSGELAGELVQINRHKIPLNDQIDKILAKAEADPALSPDVIAVIARLDSVPDSAVPLLIRTATGAKNPAPTRIQATIALSKTDREDAFNAILAALPALETDRGAEREFRRARDAFLNARYLFNHVGLFESKGAAKNGRISAWADAALLSLIKANVGSPETRAEASKAIDAGWSDVARRAQILTAVALAEYRPFSDKVLASLKDADSGVAAAARLASAKLRLDGGSKIKPRGPKIEKMKIEDVIAAIKTRKGDRDYGERLFTSLNCVNCHTIRADDPPKGPYLGNIAKTYKRVELAESILAPSKSIAQGFATNILALDDGRTLTGFVVREAADRVKIRTSDAKEIEIPTSKIEERAKSTISVMPEGLVKDLTILEFASLLDYLESPANPPSSTSK